MLGTDGAGIVVAKGSRVKGLRIGTRAYAYEFGNPKGGFYAEYAVVKARHAARVPQRLDLLQAGAAARIAFTFPHPVPDRLRRRFELACQLLGRAAGVHQLDPLATELRGDETGATSINDYENVSAVTNQITSPCRICCRIRIGWCKAEGE